MSNYLKLIAPTAASTIPYAGFANHCEDSLQSVEERAWEWWEDTEDGSSSKLTSNGGELEPFRPQKTARGMDSAWGAVDMLFSKVTSQWGLSSDESCADESGLLYRLDSDLEFTPYCKMSCELEDVGEKKKDGGMGGEEGGKRGGEEMDDGFWRRRGWGCRRRLYYEDDYILFLTRKTFPGKRTLSEVNRKLKGWNVLKVLCALFR